MFEIYKIKRLEQEARTNIEIIFKHSNDGMDRSEEKKHLEKMSLKYTSLKERFKHDKKKLFEIAIDWRDYTKNFSYQNTLREIAGAGVADGGHLKENEEIFVKMEEIGKRFDKLLKE